MFWEWIWEVQAYWAAVPGIFDWLFVLFMDSLINWDPVWPF